MPDPSADIEPETITKTQSIVKKDEAKQVVVAPVLVPGKPDREGDIVSKENIEEVAHDYLATHRLVDEQHDGIDRAGHAVVESYIAPHELDFGGGTVREGTWMAAIKLGDEAWARVESGELTGFSIQGEGRRRHGGAD